MARKVTVELTVPQAKALMRAVTEAESGELPASDAATLNRAGRKLAVALNAADPNWWDR